MSTSTFLWNSMHLRSFLSPCPAQAAVSCEFEFNTQVKREAWFCVLNALKGADPDDALAIWGLAAAHQTNPISPYLLSSIPSDGMQCQEGNGSILLQQHFDLIENSSSQACALHSSLGPGIFDALRTVIAALFKRTRDVSQEELKSCCFKVRYR